jgi:ATP/maltotriose-dependent transcriptional regulator MalT
LSDREREVLRLETQGLSDQQIAEHLMIAMGTVKRHLHNIFE